MVNREPIVPPNPRDMPRRRALLASALGACGAALTGQGARAHGTRTGNLAIDHPYATPSPPGSTVGAVYFRTLANRGKSADRLLGARASLADAVEMMRSVDDGGVARLRRLDAIDLPPGADVKLRHDGDTHLVLRGLKAPLLEGQRFTVWLRFERAGEHEVSVWVQAPRNAKAQPHVHSGESSR